MKIPKYNIGDIVGTKICSDKYYNEWYSDPSKIVKIEYVFLPYKSSMSYCHIDSSCIYWKIKEALLKEILLN